MRHRIHILFALTALVSLFFSCSPLGLKISFHDSNSLLALHQDDIEEGSRFYAMKFRQKVAWVDEGNKTFTLTINDTSKTLDPNDIGSMATEISSLDESRMYLMFRDANIQIDDTVEIEIKPNTLKLVEDGNPITSTLTITKKAVKDVTGPEEVSYIMSERPFSITKKKEMKILFKEEIRFFSNSVKDVKTNIKDFVTFKQGSNLLTINSVSIGAFGSSSSFNDALVFVLDTELVPGKLSVDIKEKTIEDIHGNPNIPISFEVEISEINSN